MAILVSYGGWGASKNGIKIGAFWAGMEISADGSQARITGAVILLDRNVSISDTVNNLSWSGGAVTDGSDANVNATGSGEKTLKSLTGQWHDLVYGATSTAAFSASLSGIDYAGGTLSVSKTVTYPARAWQPPAAITGASVARISDASQQVSWVNNATAAAPYEAIYLERQSGAGGAWVQIQTLSGGTTSYIDATTSPNTRYSYRLRAANSSGSAYSAETGWVLTSPSAPTIGAVSKSGAQITVTWTSTAPYATNFAIWHAANGVWDAAAIATVPATQLSWTHVGANTAQTHAYRIQAVAGALTSGYSAQSATVQLLAAPLAPTVTLSAQVIDTAVAGLSVSWVHNAVDATLQTAAEVQWRKVGTTVWTTAAVGAAQVHAFAAGALSNGWTWEVQVRTKGDAASFGPWSDSQLVTCSSTPQVSIQEPGSIVADAHITVVWSYFDADGTAQSQWRVTLYSSVGVALHTEQGIGTATSYAIPTLLLNDSSYSVDVSVRDGSGLWSAVASHAFTVDYPEPAPPGMGLVFDAETVSVRVIAGLTDGGAEVTTVSVYRREPDGAWILVADHVDVATAGQIEVNDPIPPLDVDVTYRVTSFTALGASASVEETVSTYSNGRFVLNAGPGWSDMAWVRGNPELTVETGVEKSRHLFAGRRRTVEYGDSEGGSRAWTLAAPVSRDAGTPRAAAYGSMPMWESFGFALAPICARFPGGMKTFVSIDPPKITAGTSPLATMSISFEETDDREN